MREGMREGEVLALTWADLDLKRGAVRLDTNKTDDPRAWVMDVGTTNALKLYKDNMRADAEPGDRVFLDPLARPHTKFGLAMLLRGHLQAIGLKAERPELLTSMASRRQLRVHDLRGTFVTITFYDLRATGITWEALAKTEFLAIMQRAGHRESKTTLGCIREAEAVALDAGDPFPPLPLSLIVATDNGHNRVSLTTPALKAGNSASGVGRRVASPRGTVQLCNSRNGREFRLRSWPRRA